MKKCGRGEFATESGARLREFAKQQHDLSSTSGVQDKAVRREPICGTLQPEGNCFYIALTEEAAPLVNHTFC